MKRFASWMISLICIVACTLSLFVLPVAAADNLLVGGDFESESLPANWTWAGLSASNIDKYAIVGGTSPMTVVAEEDGNHCLHVPEKKDGDTYVSYDRYYRGAGAEKGKTYQLSLRYKGSGLRLYFHTSYVVTGKGVVLPSATTEWTTFTHTFTTSADSLNTNFLFAIGHKNAAGSVYVDDVSLSEYVEPTGIAFEANQITLAKGESVQLSLTATPVGADLDLSRVQWTNSNPTVLSLDKGVVTGLEHGVSYVTATLGSYTASCTVIVDDGMSVFPNLVVDGDFEAEELSSNWKNFVAAPENFSFVADPADSSNTCLQISGARRMNYYGMTGAKANTTYKLTFRGKGNKRFVFDFSYAVPGNFTVQGTENYVIPNPDKTVLQLTPDSATEWKTYSVIFTTKASVNTNFIFYIGSLDSLGLMYVDDVSVMELGSGYACDGLEGGSISLNGGKEVSGQIGKTITVTAKADEGYLLVPGSLRYTTTGGITQRILNKNTETFGEGVGDTFSFEMPVENVRVMADFVKTDTTDFAWGTVGTSVHYNEDEQADGIRFLTRVNMTAFDPESDAVYYTYKGEKYQLKELGLLLKRSINKTELTYANAEQYASEKADARIWKTTTYAADKNTFRLTDYTDTYLDYTIAMVTDTPSDTFLQRVYTARGYMVLEKNGEPLLLYAGERNDSVNTTLLRLSGQLSEDVLPDEEPEEEPVEPDVQIPKDDKDYTNADLKILSIGNSYSQDAQNYLAKMAATQGKLFKCVNLYKAGCSLKTHYDGFVNNEAIYNYELSGQENLQSAVSLKAVLESDTFDVITLQSSSWQSINYSNFQPYLNNLITIIKQYQPKAKLYLHQTWAYGDGHNTHFENTSTTGGSMATMWAKIETAYNAAASATGLALIPSGEAVYNAQLAMNERNLGESIQRDQSHVSKTWGRYLLARVWYETLMGVTPNVTLSQLNSTVSLDETLEALVAKAAADAFAEYPVAQ